MQNFFEQLKTVIPICLAAGAIAITVSKSSLFQKFRLFIKAKSSWFGKLFSCPYCLSHWIIVLVMIIYSPIFVISRYAWIDWVISAFCLVGIVSIYLGIVLRLIPFKADPGGEEISHIKKLSETLQLAKTMLQQKDEEIAGLKKRLED